MQTFVYENAIVAQGKAWEIRTWFKQQLARAEDPHAPLLSSIHFTDPRDSNNMNDAAQANANSSKSNVGQVVPFRQR